MAKSRDAFRTISEVAEWLGIQAHVLRFWESKFTQVKPVKRAGGRRYYRPADMLLLGGIKKLLYEDGLTIKGVQKILREEGMSHVSDMSDPLDELTLSEMGGMSSEMSGTSKMQDMTPIEVPEAEPEPRGVVLSFDTATNEPKAKETPPPIEIKPEAAPEPQKAEALPAAEPTAEADTTPAAEQLAQAEIPAEIEPPEAEPTADALPSREAEQLAETDAPAKVEQPAEAAPNPASEVTEEPETEPDPETSLPSFLKRPLDVEAETDAEAETALAPETPDAEETPEPAASPVEEIAPKPVAAPKPRIIPMPALTPEAEIDAAPAVLTSAYLTRALDSKAAADIAPLLTRLAAHRDAMSARRNGGSAPSAGN